MALKLHQQQATTKVIILTTFAQKAYFQRAIAAEVSGYLLKDNPIDQLITTIREVMQGMTCFDSELVVNMVTAEHNSLTEREQSVLLAAVQGDTMHQISEGLYLLHGTVRNYLSAIFSKLGVHNRKEAVQLAQKNKRIV